MKPEGLLLSSQEPSTGAYPKPDESKSYQAMPSSFSMIRFANWRAKNTFPPIGWASASVPWITVWEAQESLEMVSCRKSGESVSRDEPRETASYGQSSSPGCVPHKCVAARYTSVTAPFQMNRFSSNLVLHVHAKIYQ
jgi:hypothetical protein